MSVPRLSFREPPLRIKIRKAPGKAPGKAPNSVAIPPPVHIEEPVKKNNRIILT